jgi:hypothetical protein
MLFCCYRQPITRAGRRYATDNFLGLVQRNVANGRNMTGLAQQSMIVGGANLKQFFAALCWPTLDTAELQELVTTGTTSSGQATSCTREFLLGMSSAQHFAAYYANVLGSPQKEMLSAACLASAVAVVPPQVKPADSQCWHQTSGCSNCCDAYDSCGDTDSTSQQDSHSHVGLCRRGCGCCWGGHFAGCNCDTDCMFGCRCHGPPSPDAAAAQTCQQPPGLFSQPQSEQAKFWHNVMIETISFYNRFQTYGLSSADTLKNVLDGVVGAAYLPASHVVGSDCAASDLWTERRVLENGQLINNVKG